VAEEVNPGLRPLVATAGSPPGLRTNHPKLLPGFSIQILATVAGFTTLPWAKLRMNVNKSPVVE
jgi:hypothetical protein